MKATNKKVKQEVDIFVYLSHWVSDLPLHTKLEIHRTPKVFFVKVMEPKKKRTP